jgi:hypothetical protein
MAVFSPKTFVVVATILLAATVIGSMAAFAKELRVVGWRLSCAVIAIKLGRNFRHYINTPQALKTSPDFRRPRGFP